MLKSVCCTLTKCENPGALILHRYGLLLPSETRYTPNSPCKTKDVL